MHNPLLAYSPAEIRICSPGHIVASDEEAMKLAIELSAAAVTAGEGGPFGALVLDAENRVIAAASNRVFALDDCTAHAEVLALRRAQAQRRQADAEGLRLISSCAPCMMCAGAISFAGISEVLAAGRSADAEALGYVEGPPGYDAGEALHALGIGYRGDFLRDEALPVFRLANRLMPPAPTRP